MKKLEKQELIHEINLIGGAIGFFLIWLGFYLIFEINIKFLIFSLIFVGIILLIWRFILEKKLK